MIDYIKKLQSDLLEQFKGRAKIDALLQIIGRQFNDVFRFYEQLRTETDVDSAVGQQLDGIGDIIVLSRQEAGKLIARQDAAANPDDETYRRYLIYKILKNTCDCTYGDIMKAIGLFWKGPPLRYSEDPSKPATICFDFEASKDLADQSLDIPFVKAGGVGLQMTMHQKNQLTTYVGFAVQRMVTTRIECEEAVINEQTFLSDEHDNILVDEAGAWLVE